MHDCFLIMCCSPAYLNKIERPTPLLHTTTDLSQVTPPTGLLVPLKHTCTQLSRNTRTSIISAKLLMLP